MRGAERLRGSGRIRFCEVLPGSPDTIGQCGTLLSPLLSSFVYFLRRERIEDISFHPEPPERCVTTFVGSRTRTMSRHNHDRLTRLRDVLCRRCSKSLDPAKLRRNLNGPLFKVAKEYEHLDSFASSLDHPNNIRESIPAKDHGPLREFHKPSVPRFAGNDRNRFS